MPWRALLIVWLASGCDGVFGLDLRAGEDGGARDAGVLDADADLDAALDAAGDAAPDAPIGPIMQVAAGGAHTCAVASGVVKCWGLSDSGQLGYAVLGDVGDDEQPRTHLGVNVGPGIVDLALGGAHTCARASTGSVRCWGQATFGQLGYGNLDPIGDTEAPVTAGDVNVGGVVAQVVAGDAHTCALINDGSVRCWGTNASGQLGSGNFTNPQVGDDEVPSAVGSVALGAAALHLAAGDAHTCAVLADGSVRCWGSGLNGRLGYGNVASVGDNETPSQQAAIVFSPPAVEVAAGAAHSCARLTDGTVHCWGSGGFGQLGYGGTTTIGDNESASTALAVSLGASATAITAGGEHTCALLVGGNVRCWGRGASGELGNGSINNIGDGEVPSAVAVVPVGGTVTQISAGRTHTCAVLTTGAVRCWGNGLNGRLGHGTGLTIGDNEPASEGGDVPAY